jgi:hypothetical protein
MVHGLYIHKNLKNLKLAKLGAHLIAPLLTILSPPSPTW